jgi:hypothetical protein
MNHEPTGTAGLRPVIPTPDEVGDEEYVELKKIIKLEAAIDFAITVPMRTTYKPLGLVSGWFWRDATFHTALGVISEKAIARGEGAKSAQAASSTRWSSGPAISPSPDCRTASTTPPRPRRSGSARW